MNASNFGPFLSILALLLGTAQGSPSGAQTSDAAPWDADSSFPEILNAIGELESTSDAKCQATAERLENFMYGTPLTDGARFARNELQKELVDRLWREASEAARGAGEERLTGEHVRPLAGRILDMERQDDGTVTVRPSSGPLLVLTPTDLRQYSSVAYSLRAILAVEQDSLFSGRGDLLSADRSALDVMRELVDVHTLATLQLADRRARTLDLTSVARDELAGAWSALAPTVAGATAAGATAAGATAAGTTAAPPAVRPSQATGKTPELAVMRAIIREKIAAYENYNQIDRDNAEKLFRRNISRFYARYALPPTRRAMRLLDLAFAQAMNDYVQRVLNFSQQLARRSGSPVIRAPHVAAIVQALAPHEVDDLEDVVYFPRLPKERQCRLESFDMDSFRDFGMHWRRLDEALGTSGTPEFVEMDLDPFAAERVAESIAQYGVLLFRIAGDMARDEKEWPFIHPSHFERAAQAIPLLAQMNQQQPAPPKASPTLASAAETTTPAERDALFADATAAVGLTYEHRSADWLSRLRRTLLVFPPTFSGGGIAAEDVDGDGWIDLLLVGGMGNALYMNDGAGRFTDVTEAAGLRHERPDGYPGEARQPIVADFDNDGRQDILITYVDEPHRLYRNLGGRRFADVTASAGLGGEGLVGGPATVFDFDGDGLLDVYIGYFGNYMESVVPEDNNWGFEPDERLQQLEYEGDRPTLSRDNRNALPNRLLRNRGGLRFTDVTESSGTGDTGWAQAVGHSDLNLDGRQDIVVANDFGRNAWLLNRGGGRFDDVSDEIGMDRAYHSMNVGVGDLNQDGRPDIYISNINTMVKDQGYVLPSEETAMGLDPEALATMRIIETSLLYVSAGRGEPPGFEVSDALSRGETRVGWAWDADFFDYDNDGDDDLYVVNGANEYRIFDKMWLEKKSEDSIQVHHLTHDRESNVLYTNSGGKLRNQSTGSGSDLVSNARSAAYLDVDLDGDLDVAINNFQSAATFLENRSERLGHNWMQVRLIGDPSKGSNRDAVGARLVATTPGGQRVWREVHGGSGYLSMEPKLQHLGLGKESSADLEIVWPGGEVQTVSGLAANRIYAIEQGGEPRVVEPARGP